MKKFLAMMMAFTLILSVVAVGANGDADKDTTQKVQTALNEMGYDCGTPDGISMTSGALYNDFSELYSSFPCEIK